MVPGILKNLISSNYLGWYALAVVLTAALSISNIDAWYFAYFQDTNAYAFFGLAGLLGFFVPIIGWGVLLIVGSINKSQRLQKAAWMFALSGVIGYLFSTFLKLFTGRVGPPHGIVSNLIELSHKFQLGIYEGGVFWGWPSSHTTVAFAGSVALAVYYKDKKWVGVLAIIYATYIGIGASMSFHWLGDVVAGIIFGSIIGMVVGKIASKPAHKTVVESRELIKILRKEFNGPVSEIVALTGGEGSQAYSFKFNNEFYVIRVSDKGAETYFKDKYAYDHFRSASIPMPEVLKVHEGDNGYSYAITKKVEGKLIKNLSQEGLEKTIPDLFKVLDEIHKTDISKTTRYADWNRHGVGISNSWKEAILDVGEFIIDKKTGKSMFDTTMLEKDFWNKSLARLVELVEFCPEERWLVHGDYGSDNVLADHGKITGVIDWGGSMYGDFLYDIAWLEFFSKGYPYEEAYKKHLFSQGRLPQDFDTRVLCYKLWIAMSSLSFYAYSEQKDKYERSKGKIERFLQK